MESRAAVSPVVPQASAASEAVAVEPAPLAGAARSRESVGRRSRPVARPIALSREEEYRYIRSDLNRLLITASSLLALMIVLLLVLEVLEL